MSKSDLKFLVDVGVGKNVEDFLIVSKYDVKKIREIDHKMKDIEILNIAISERRIVVTMDKDFGELVFNSGLSHFGVLLLRLDNSNGKEKVEVIKEILLKHEENLKNNFCVFQNSKLRVKKG